MSHPRRTPEKLLGVRVPLPLARSLAVEAELDPKVGSVSELVRQILAGALQRRRRSRRVLTKK